MRFFMPYSAVQWRENNRTTSKYAGEHLRKRMLRIWETETHTAQRLIGGMTLAR